MLRKCKKLKEVVLLLLLLFLSLNSLFAIQDDLTYVPFLSYDISKEAILEKNYNTIYVASSSPTSDHVGSLGAHAMLILSRGDDINNAIAINYFAHHERMTEFEKITKGATVGLNGYIDIRDFSLIAERYTVGQNRTLFLYKTNISKEKIPELLDIIYEYKAKDLKYQFFTYNCSSLIGDVLSKLLSDEENNYHFPTSLMPARLISFVERYGFVVDKKVVSPSLIKLLHNQSSLTKEEILERHDYFEVFNRETSELVGFEKFAVTFDKFNSNTMFNEKVSKLSIGSLNNNLTLNFSLFTNDVTEQRQSATSLYTAKFLDGKLSYENSSVILKELTIFEKSAYNKVNLFKNKTSSYFALKYNPNNINFDVRYGLGYSVGGEKSLISVIPFVDLNINSLELSINIKSLLKLNYEKAYCLFELDYPIYNEQSYTTKKLNLNLGYRFNDEWLIDASYDFLNQEYSIYLTYFIYPLIY